MDTWMDGWTGGETPLTRALDMSANRWKYFRWTPRTAWITFVYVVAVPSVIGYVGYVTEVSRRFLSSLDSKDGRCVGWDGEREGERVCVEGK